jgi:hypothetical protein
MSIADLFVNGTAGPQPAGNTVHGGMGLRIDYEGGLPPLPCPFFTGKGLG